MKGMTNKPETKCDRCERQAECYKEGRLVGYTSLSDIYVYSELGGHGHAMKGIGETCPAK